MAIWQGMKDWLPMFLVSFVIPHNRITEKRLVKEAPTLSMASKDRGDKDTVLDALLSSTLCEDVSKQESCN
jgi:hypothetical protein